MTANLFLVEVVPQIEASTELPRWWGGRRATACRGCSCGQRLGVRHQGVLLVGGAAGGRAARASRETALQAVGQVIYLNNKISPALRAKVDIYYTNFQGVGP